jgi:hypothetical protein
VYDQCDVCGGNSSTCLDCTGKINGPNRYDVCDICAGNGRSCLDCAGKPFGKTVYDVCGVCGGNGSECKDCLGVIMGTSTYDNCGICNGDGSTCKPIDCTTASDLSDASHPEWPQTMNALKRRLDELRHHHEVLRYKTHRLTRECDRRDRSRSSLRCVVSSRNALVCERHFPF